MKPDVKCNLGHERPKVCTQTLFGLHLETNNGKAIIHGDMRIRKEK